MSAPSNPIAAAFAVTPAWMLAIRDFNAIEVHPCCVVGFACGVELIETCEPQDVPQGFGARTRILRALRGHDNSSFRPHGIRFQRVNSATALTDGGVTIEV